MPPRKQTAARKAPAKSRAPTTTALQKQINENQAQANERMDSLEAGVGDLGAKMDVLLDRLAPKQGEPPPAADDDYAREFYDQHPSQPLVGMRAQDRPTGPAVHYHEAEEVADHENVATLERGADDKLAMKFLKPGQTLDDPEVRAKVEIERFMREKLVIRISEVSDELQDQSFSIWVNGEAHSFIRGRTFKDVPRYVVEGLARAKPTAYSYKEVERDGVRGVEYRTHTGLRYPFQVIHDPSGERGINWLDRVLQEP